MLHLDVRPRRELPYECRRQPLLDLGLDDGACWRTPRHFVTDSDRVLAATREHGLEGVVAKRLGSPYLPGTRNGAWVKQQVLSGRKTTDPRVGRLLVGKCLCGVAARRWPAGLELPDEERETVDAALRQIDFLERELQEAERVIAKEALSSVETRRPMSVPGVNVITAATFLAARGDVSRCRSARRLVGYLGLDPRVRRSGPGPAKRGRISKQGSAPARYALVEAACSVVRQPGPLPAFCERIRARRGHQVAIVASARKLACLMPLRCGTPQSSISRTVRRRFCCSSSSRRAPVRAQSR